ncbi:MAG: DUF2620 domain-containing protein [Synergistaceae bacterium]|jgi:hypothetical protein|nr:DUF2620 domain-containing protein [Synergistaceae bacterium]
MVRIIVGGQMEKARIADLVRKLGGERVEVQVKSDLEAAMSVKRGEADCYFGCCATGGGGSLAGAIAILGYGQCVSVSMPGIAPDRNKIEQAVAEGKKAFGFTDGHVDSAVALLMEVLLKREAALKNPSAE